MKTKKYKSYKGAHYFFRVFAEPGLYAGFVWVALLILLMLYPNNLSIKGSFVMISACWISAFVWYIKSKKARFVFKADAPKFVTVGQKNNLILNIKNLNKVKNDWIVRIVCEKKINEDTFKYNKWLYNPNLTKWAGRWGIDNKLGFTEEDLSHVSFEDVRWDGQKELKIEMFGRSRGLSKIEGVRISRTDPLGWLSRSMFFPLDNLQNVYVLPEPVEQKHIQSNKSSSSSNRKDIKSKKILSSGDEPLGLREARDNDPLKDTHWKSFAKTGKRWVFEKQELEQSKSSIIIDTTLKDFKDLESFEILMENVAGQLMPEKGRKDIEWIFIGKERFGSSNASFDSVMQKIAMSSYSAEEDTDKQWEQLEGQWKNISMLKVFTTRTEEEMSKWLSVWNKWGIYVEIITIKEGILNV